MTHWFYRKQYVSLPTSQWLKRFIFTSNNNPLAYLHYDIWKFATHWVTILPLSIALKLTAFASSIGKLMYWLIYLWPNFMKHVCKTTQWYIIKSDNNCIWMFHWLINIIFSKYELGIFPKTWLFYQSEIF